MEQTRTLSKIISGEVVNYDRNLDIIYGDHIRLDTPFKRNQSGLSVDVCLEITDVCNAQCANCFSESGLGKKGTYLPYHAIRSILNAQQHTIIRACITGGEPFMHPDIEIILKLASEFPNIGFVVSTNGMLRPDVNSMLLENGWLVSVSIHGNREAHNSYMQVDGFDVVTTRIRTLSKLGVPLHLYSVINDRMTNRDIEWLLRFRDEVQADFLRFIVPRPHGRSERLSNSWLIECACSYSCDKTNVIFESSDAWFYDRNGNKRLSK